MAPAPRSHEDVPAAPPAESPRRFSISELSREFDVTPRTIRFYEDLGLLQPLRVGRQRVYAQRDRIRLGLILRGKRLGFSLHEARELVMMYESPADTEPQLLAFLKAIRDKRAQLESQLDDLRVTLADLAEHERRCEEALATERARQRTAPSTA